MERITESSKMPVLRTEFASIKLARPFVAWLKREAARRGVYLYVLVEELVARGQKAPWR